MSKRILTSILGLILLVLITLSACSQPILEDMPAGTQWPDAVDELNLKVGEVAITVLQAQMRTSYQTHYLMTYAEDRTIFFEIILLIEGPEDPLLWGQENLALVYQGNASDLALARPVILDEQVEYRSGQDLTYGYVYIYQVQKDSRYDQYVLSAGAGKSLSLASVLQTINAVELEGPILQAGPYDVLAGGLENLAAGPYATVGGGSHNLASAYHTYVGGGNLNIASASHATIAGGRENTADNFYAAIGGGYANLASGRDAVIAGGSRNTASKHHATVGGGIQNQANSTDSTVSGGSYNQASGVYAAVGGGTRNQSSGYAAVITGGAGNLASGDHAAIGGGLGNQAGGAYAVVGGGHGNMVMGNYSATPGGALNQVLSDFSLAAGYRGQIASDYPGVFIFSDSTDSDFHSLAANEFAVRASGGVRFVTGLDESGEPQVGANLPPGSGAWSVMSDRQAKANLEPVNGVDILEILSTLPLSTWNYVAQGDSVRHIGPMAQEFYSRFGVGENERYISTVDADGVALASIQGLYHLVEQQQTQLIAQQEQINALESRLEQLETHQTGEFFGLSGSSFIGLLSWFVLCFLGWRIMRVQPRSDVQVM